MEKKSVKSSNRLVSLVFALILVFICSFSISSVDASTSKSIDKSKIISQSNNEEFKKIVTTNDSGVDYEKYFTDRIGKIIEFDGNIAYLNQHESYKTRFDILIYCQDYSEETCVGPSFQFNDVNITYDLNLVGENIPDNISVGQNIHIIAKVMEYTKGELVRLEPIEISFRP